MEAALYGRDGFFVRDVEGPADHFRTSVHASPLFAGALLRLLRRVDQALGHPPRLDLVDVGAGRGELLTTMAALLASEEPTPGPGSLAERARLVAVELRSRPDGLDLRIGWSREVPDGIVGLLIATEWLDNVPIDIVAVDDVGQLRLVQVDRSSGKETLGGAPDAADVFWLARWWPLWSPAQRDHRAAQHLVRHGRAGAGDAPAPAAGEQTDPGPRGAGATGEPADTAWARAEIGWPRDVAWADAVSAVRRGCALTVDYGHLRELRPAHGTLTGFRGGRQVTPVPDGSCDVTAHVAMDSVACAAGTPYTLITQREALKALGIDGARPSLHLARTDPAAYLRALSAAGSAAELIDPAGLGGHWWLLHSVGIDHRGSMLR